MRQLLYIIYIIGVATVLTGCGADQAVKKGDKFYALGEYYDAATQYKKAYAQTPAKERTTRGLRALKMADCYRRINYTQRAIAAYNNAVRYKQADSTAMLYLGQMQLKNGNYKDAEKTFKTLLEAGTEPADVKTGSKAGGQKLTVKKARKKSGKKSNKKSSKKNKKKEQETDEQPAEKTTAGNAPLLPKPLPAADIVELANTGLESARMAPAWKAEGSKYTVKRQDLFNSRRAEYSPMLAGDEDDQLYFSSTRNQAQGDELSGITGTKNADIFFSQKDDKGKWGKPQAIESELNTELDEGACSFAPDGKTMYLTQCKTDPDYPRYAQICTSKRSDASWGKATPIEISRDTLSTFAHPAVSPDGEWLYFTSDMPGGMGGYDIWRAQITTNGIGAVENLGAPINTAGNEMFPTFRPNGDLYFSSDGHPGMGGLDIFIARPAEAGELRAAAGEVLSAADGETPSHASGSRLQHYTLEHPGYPLNSAGDDFGMTFEGLHNRGYFSSNRGDARGWDHIYSFEKSEVVLTVKGWVYEQEGYELPAAQVYMVGNDGTNLKLNVKGDGSFTQEIETGVDYVLLGTCKGFLNHKEELRVDTATVSNEYVLQFPLANISAPVLIENIFYDFDKATLRPESKTALDELVKLLEENPNVTIELSAHTDYRGSAQYNKRLSQRRAESVVNYLIEHGIASDRLSPVGYGKEKPKTIRRKLTEKYPWLKADDVLTEAFIKSLKDEEQQEICNQLNRRTEFIVLRTTYGLFDEKGRLKEVPKPKTAPQEQSQPQQDDDWF